MGQPQTGDEEAARADRIDGAAGVASVFADPRSHPTFRIDALRFRLARSTRPS